MFCFHQAFFYNGWRCGWRGRGFQCANRRPVVCYGGSVVLLESQTVLAGFLLCRNSRSHLQTVSIQFQRLRVSGQLWPVHTRGKNFHSLKDQILYTLPPASFAKANRTFRVMKSRFTLFCDCSLRFDLQIIQPINYNVSIFVPAVVLGIVGGILGAIFTRLNDAMNRGRKEILSHIKNAHVKRIVRIIEAVLLVVCTNLQTLLYPNNVSPQLSSGPLRESMNLFGEKLPFDSVFDFVWFLLDLGVWIAEHDGRSKCLFPIRIWLQRDAL